MTIDVFESAVHLEGTYGAVFERDDKTAYFYLLDLRREADRIISALAVKAVTRMAADVRIAVRWANTGTVAGLFAEDRLLAVFDLDAVPENPGRSGRMASPDDPIRFGIY